MTIDLPTDFVSADLGRRRALLVDDDVLFRTLCLEVLEGLDIVVDEACDGEEAVARFKQAHGAFDLVLLDLGMERMDGFQACSAIRSMPGGDDVTIIVTTGSDDQASIQRAFVLGATDFITKPINWPIFAQRLRYILRSRAAFRALTESERRLAQAQEIAQLGSWEWEVNGDRMRWSQQTARLLGLDGDGSDAPSYAAFLGRVHPQDQSALSTAIGAAIQNPGTFELEHRIRHPLRGQRIVRTQGAALRGEDGRTRLVRAISQDITERKQFEERINRLSYYDDLTGLPNRELFFEQVQRTVSGADASEVVAILYLDIDRFRRINDSLGHAVGDELLRIVAQRAIETVRRFDARAQHGAMDLPRFALGRLGADELSVLLRGLETGEPGARLALQLQDAIARPIRIEGEELFVSASIGIALYPADGEDPDALLRNAHLALNHAKQIGGSEYRFYAAEMNELTLVRFNIESRLNRALERNELRLHYQPQVDVKSGELMGFEALLRWRPEGEKWLSPAEFIPIAEETGLIVPIGAWVLNAVCAQMADWRKRGLRQVPVAVNLSARQFEHDDLIDEIEAALKRHAIAPCWLHLECTETVIMRDIDATGSRLRQLSEIGLRVAVDDFGIGYSSLSYLKRFPLDILKIDRSFIQELSSSQIDREIAASIIVLAKSLGLKSVAEGVEQEDQLAILSELGCDWYQGFLFGHPEPPEQAERWLCAENAH
ncbi:MAG: EAL domain-containing protein [Thiohalocapsa sp.]